MDHPVPFLESLRLEIKSARPRDNGEPCLPLSRWRGGGNKVDAQRNRLGEEPLAWSPGVRCSRRTAVPHHRIPDSAPDPQSNVAQVGFL